jgi:hypothetical protein
VLLTMVHPATILEVIKSGNLDSVGEPAKEAQAVPSEEGVDKSA